MIAPRWRKVMRDAQQARGRLYMMIAALSAGIAGVVVMLSTYYVLTREVPANYRRTHPASAELQLARALPPEAFRVLESVPNVEAVTVAARVRGRLQTGPGEWIDILLFVQPDLATAKIGTVALQPGGQYPGAREVAIERSALALSKHRVGDLILIEREGHGIDSLRVSGMVHDAGVAPAWQEQTVYAYVSLATMHAIGGTPPLTRVSIRVRDGQTDAHEIERTALDVAKAVARFGIEVDEIRIPPPEQHPHQAQMNAVIKMLLVFSLLALLLAAMLTSTIVSALLAQQVRSIAIMKAIGARSGQIRAGYLVFVAAIGVGALAIGLPVGLFGGRALLRAIAELLNLELASLSLPWSLYIGTAALAVSLPVLLALLPISSAARRSVRDALDDTGVPMDGGRSLALLRLASRLRIRAAWLNLALRNVIRRRQRLLFTALLMSFAGAMFLASLNLRSAWLTTVASSASARRYQLEIGVAGDTPIALVRNVLEQLPEVARVEAWRSERASAEDNGGILITTVYPDGAHGRIQARVAPVATQLIAHEITHGRWLMSNDSNAVVLNSLALRQTYPTAQVGDTISITIGDASLHLRLVGISRERLTPAAAYISPRTYLRVAADTATSNAFRIALREPERADEAAGAIRTALAEAGIAVGGTVAEARLASAQGGHVYILVVALAVIAGIMSLIGVLGLSSSLGISVVERTKELGVMRAVGATHSAIIRMVLAEGACIAAVSWGMAMLLGVPLSAAVGRVLAAISAQELTLFLAPTAAALWFLLVVGGAVLVSLIPARRATRIHVRDALNFT